MSQSKIAYKIRRAAYRARIKSEIIARKYKCFSPDTLSGFCARASSILFFELLKEGFQSIIMYTTGHVYIYCVGYYVDITATQFGPFGKTVVRKERTIDHLNARLKTNSPIWGLEYVTASCSHPDYLLQWQIDTTWKLPEGVLNPDDWLEYKGLNENDVEYKTVLPSWY